MIIQHSFYAGWYCADIQLAYLINGWLLFLYAYAHAKFSYKFASYQEKLLVVKFEAKKVSKSLNFDYRCQRVKTCDLLWYFAIFLIFFDLLRSFLIFCDLFWFFAIFFDLLRFFFYLLRSFLIFCDPFWFFDIPTPW